jgi:flagellar protein FlbD
MIHLTRLNHISLVVNADLIEFIEVTPDTVISLTTGQKLVVLESAGEVVRRVVEFRRAIFAGALQCPRIAREQTAVSGNRSGASGGRQNPHGSET